MAGEAESKTGGFFSAQEALALVAFGDPRALDDEAASDADEERAARLDQADRELCALVAKGAESDPAGAVQVLGQRGSYATGRFVSSAHEPVPAAFFASPTRTLNTRGGWATVRVEDISFREYEHWRMQPAPDWGDLPFDRAALLSRFGPTALSPADVKPERPGSPKRPSGGRPEREDWNLFDQEVSRRLALDDGNLTKRELRRQMKDWAAEHMPCPPDDRTIERRLDQRVPNDVFPAD